MSFWQLLALSLVSGGILLFLLKWFRESRERKARKVSYHAKRLLEQADGLCGIANAMAEVAKKAPGSAACRKQASALWQQSSSSILNVWLANSWVLDKNKNWQGLRQDVIDSVEQLCECAREWHTADMAWREAKRITESETLVGGGPENDSSPEAARKREAAERCDTAVQRFLKVFQDLHNELQPTVREYASD